MYMQAVLSRPLQPSHLSVRTNVGIFLYFKLLQLMFAALNGQQRSLESLLFGGMSAHFDFNLVLILDAGVVLAQDGEHFRT